MLANNAFNKQVEMKCVVYIFGQGLQLNWRENVGYLTSVIPEGKCECLNQKYEQ